MKSKRLAPGGGVAMTNDAKLGLVVGIGVVILIAIVFFRRDLAVARAAPGPGAVAQVQPAAVPSARPAPPAQTALPKRGDRVDSNQTLATPRP